MTAFSRKHALSLEIFYSLGEYENFHNSFIQLRNNYVNYFDTPYHADKCVNITIYLNVV